VVFRWRGSTTPQGTRFGTLAVVLAFSLCQAVGQLLPAADLMPDTVAPGAKLVEAYHDPRVFDGPTWDQGTGKLYFTARDANNHTQILRLDGLGKVQIFQYNTEGVYGTYRSLDGQLLGAQVFGHNVVSYSFSTGRMKVLAHDPAWNQPNDVCQTASGDIFFTDPDFNRGKNSAVFRLSQGKVTKVVTNMPMPNGCIASNDGRTLYVGDSHDKNWRAFPIAANGSLGPGRVFFDPDTEDTDSPDGMTTDEHGNLYFTGRGGIWVVTPAGESKGMILVPEYCTNVCFGGADGKTLYITCKKKLYQLAMQVRGGSESKPTQ
jgi:gluconolactonase